jgi:hypothetical protein
VVGVVSLAGDFDADLLRVPALLWIKIIRLPYVQGSNALLIMVSATKEGPGVGVMYQMQSRREGPGPLISKIPYLSGIRKVNHAEPVLNYAFAMMFYSKVDVDALNMF